MARKQNSYFNFPSNQELEKIIQRNQKSDQRTNLGLTLDATPVEKIKHKLCQSILAYQQDNNISPKLLAKKLEITLTKLEKILYGHINNFTLDELFSYSAQLFVPCKVLLLYHKKRDIIYAS